MRKTRKFSFAAAMAVIFAALVIIMPLISLKASASSLTEIYKDAKLGGGVYKAALMDADFYNSKNGVLTASEESALLAVMEKTAEKIKCNVGIVITHDLKNMSPQRYNANFSATVFGAYTDSATLLLLNRHGNAQYISLDYADDLFFSDRADTLFSKNSERIFTRIYKAIDKDADDFVGACTNFCKALEAYGSSTGRIAASISIDGTTVMMALIFGVVISFIIVTSFQRGYRKKTPISASHYIDKSRTRITRQEDIFLREHTTSVHLSSSSSSGHHGGGGHSSGGHHSSHHSGRGR